MNVTIRYTQPKFSEHHKPKQVDHVIPCHDADTFPNGMPVPLESHKNWHSTFQAIESLTSYEVVT